MAFTSPVGVDFCVSIVILILKIIKIIIFLKHFYKGYNL